MIRLFLVLLSCLCSFSALSAPVTLDLVDVRLRDLVRLVYADVLPRSVVLDSDVAKDERSVTLSLKRVSPAAVEVETRRLLESHGYSVSEVGGVVRVGKLPEPETADFEPFVYVPAYRSVSYLLDVAAALFKAGSFSAIRSGGVNIAQVQGTHGSSVPPASGVAESGVNRAASRDPDVLVFKGAAKDVQRLKTLLAQVDTPASEMIVKAVVYEVNTTKKTGSALNLAMTIFAGRLGLVLDGAALSGAALKIKNNALSIDALYSALASDDRFKVVTAPSVRVRSGASARFAVGSETPVLDKVTFDQLGKPIQSVAYKPSGVIFDLKPEIRGQVADLQIFQQISQFVPTTTGVDSSPTLIKRELQTSVSAAADDVIVIGGLDEDRSSASNSGQSFLPRWLWNEREENQRTEIMLVLHVQRI